MFIVNLKRMLLFPKEITTVENAVIYVINW